MLFGYLRPLGDVEGICQGSRFSSRLQSLWCSTLDPKGPCRQILKLYTLAPKYLSRDYFKAKVCTICIHGRLG